MSGGNSLPLPDLNYLSNAEEADMRIWRHATQTSAQHILVYSPDTDVYNIGVPIIQERRLSTQCIIQLNGPHSQVLKYLHINNLTQALEDDPDLATLPMQQTQQNQWRRDTRIGIQKSEVLLVIGYQMRRNECPHKHQCGATGYVHAGCLKCGDMHQNLTFLVN